jgi:chemotaxis protein methyltransferase CheR
MMRELALSPSLFAILSGLVEERTGIHYDAQDNAIFSSKLVARALEAGFESPLDYYYYLRYDDSDRREFDALTDSLVVNETYFFREVGPLHVVCDDVLRAAIDRGARPRVWCAASSTGEEPLTLAMLLAERGLLGHVEIIASDISPRALARAKEGVYGGRSLRAISNDAQARWFDESGEKALVRREVRDAINWRRINLMDRAAIGAIGAFDVILCRNVLIYFSETSVRHVAETLAMALREGGRLLVGASESLLRFGTLLVCEERGGSFFYKKAAS